MTIPWVYDRPSEEGQAVLVVLEIRNSFNDVARLGAGKFTKLIPAELFRGVGLWGKVKRDAE